MTTIEVLRWLDLVAVGAVCVSTVYVLQKMLPNAHHLLRLGLVLVCVGNVLDLYNALQEVTEPTLMQAVGSLACNLGQATVYVWVANSRTVWLMIRQAELTTYRHLFDGGKRGRV